jgi:predicted nucleic acid-binding protein
MRLLDSNIIIYATDPENEWLRIWLEAEPFAISQISQIEVLGYHQITPEEITDLQEFLYSSNVLPVSDEAASNRTPPTAKNEFGRFYSGCHRVGK